MCQVSEGLALACQIVLCCCCWCVGFFFGGGGGGSCSVSVCRGVAVVCQFLRG